MKLVIISLVILLSFFSGMVFSDQAMELQWQLPVGSNGTLYSGQNKTLLNIRLQACSGEDCGQRLKSLNTVSNGQGKVSTQNATLITEPGQQVAICCEELLWDSDSLHQSPLDLSASLDKERLVYQIRTRDTITPLTLINPTGCPKQFSTLYNYKSGDVFFSNKPFLVRTPLEKETSAVKSGQQGSDKLLPVDPSPCAGSEESMTFDGGGFDPGVDDFFPKRPGHGLIATSSDLSLTLLPLIRLDWDWQRILPLDHWRQWLLGTRDESSGAVVQIRVNGRLMDTLRLSQQELRQFLPTMTSINTALRWLAPKLNGREALIEQLLACNSADNSLPSEVRQAIEQQLAVVLEYADNEFSQLHLDFEIHQLQKTLTEAQHGGPSIQSLPVSHDPEQGMIRFSDDNGKSEQQGGVGAAEQSSNQEDHSEQSQDSSGAHQNNPSDHDGAEPDPDPVNNAPPPASGTTDAAGSSEPVTITFIGQVNAGKSSLANRLLQINHFDAQLTHVSDHEPDFVLPNIKIRALPGYGGPFLTADSFLEQEDFSIKDNEVVIMVMANEMSLEDQIVLQNLLNDGHPPERVLMVYNKFDRIVEGKAGRQQIATDSSRVALENSIKKELMVRQLKILEKLQPEVVTGESSARLTQSLQVLANRLKAQKEQDKQDKPFLLFTSASDVSTYSPEQDEELIKAISSALTGQEKKTFKEQFLDIRPGKVKQKQFADFISPRFSAVIEDAKAGGVVKENVFGSLFRQLNNDFGLYPEKDSNYWLGEFSKIYKTDFNEEIKKIVNGDDSWLDTLQKQFIAFYTGRILGTIWYEFVRNRRDERKDDLGQSPLHRWARNGKSGWVWLWLQLHSEEAGTLLNARDINERTPLHLAVYSGNEDTVRYILEHSPNVDAKDSVDYTPLHWAAFFGRETIAEQLLRHNASLTGQHRLRITPLHVAAWNNQGTMVNKLLEWGAIIDSSAYGIYPIHYAAATGSLSSLEALLAHRLNDLDVFCITGSFNSLAYRPIDLNVLISSGHSALHIAAWYGHRKTVAKLIAAGADQKQLTKDGYMAGDLAKFRGHKYLGLSVSEKDVDQQNPKAPDRTHLAIPIAIDLESMHIDQYGYSTLHRAAREGDVNRVRDILNNNKYTSTRSAMSGYTPLHVAALFGHKEIAALLLSPANREDKDVSGNTPLHLAALFNRETMIAFLLDHSCRPDATNHSGIAVLHVVSAMGSRSTLERIFESLKQCKWDCNPTVNGITAMHIAAKYGNIEAIRFLNQVAGISLEIETASGETPLHSATHTGQVETVKWLKITGVNLAPANKKGVTPLFMAAAINSTELIELLGQEGKPEHLTKIIGLLPKHFGVASFSSIDEPLLLTPLHFAALKGNLEAVQALVMKCGAKLNTRSSGLTALHFASQGGHLKVVQWLIDE